VLWHALPESLRVQRARFAAQLRFLGFGSVQDATWVAARDREVEVRRLLAQLGIEAYVSVLVGRLAHDPPPRALVAQAWRMEETAARYEAFLADQRDLVSARGRARLDPAEAFRRRMLMLHRFRAFPSADPELPPDIDPLGELRARVVDCFTQLYEALQAPSEAYFRTAVAPPGDNT
jgi:phenylacetic acid degradation operon negative regulatory protein